MPFVIKASLFGGSPLVAYFFPALVKTNYKYKKLSLSRRYPVYKVAKQYLFRAGGRYRSVAQTKIALMELVKNVKGNSSKWVKRKDTNLANFYWQDGYGAFSVNPKEVDIAIRYTFHGLVLSVLAQ